MNDILQGWQISDSGFCQIVQKLKSFEKLMDITEGSVYDDVLKEVQNDDRNCNNYLINN